MSGRPLPHTPAEGSDGGLRLGEWLHAGHLSRAHEPVGTSSTGPRPRNRVLKSRPARTGVSVDKGESATHLLYRHRVQCTRLCGHAGTVLELAHGLQDDAQDVSAPHAVRHAHFHLRATSQLTSSGRQPKRDA